jgi:hypothetical protein
MRTISRTITLTKAQIDALDSTAVEILEPCAAGKALVLLGAQAWKTAGGQTAGTSRTFNFVYSATASTAISTLAAINSATGALDTDNNRIQSAVGTANASPASGDGISIKASGAITAAANTLLKIKVDFQIIDL